MIECPFCSKYRFGVGHIGIGRTFGPWFCEQCGQSILGKIISDGWVELTRGTERKVNTQITLQIQEAPVTFIINEFLIIDNDETPEQSVAMENQQYFYEEHTCPTNVLPNVDEIIDSHGKADPHGIFHYIKTEVVQ